jgi:hypothetical protein
MKILYERQGGITGMPVKVTVDTDSLPEGTAKAFQEAFSAARFFELPAKLTRSAPGSDQFTHHLTVEDESRQHTVEMVDSTVPEPLQPVLRQLALLARKQNLT